MTRRRRAAALASIVAAAFPVVPLASALAPSSPAVDAAAGRDYACVVLPVLPGICIPDIFAVGGAR